MNEEELVQYLTQQLIDDVNVQTYLSELYFEPEQEGYLTEAQLELADAQDVAYHSSYTNHLVRLLGLVTAQLYNPPTVDEEKNNE
ncbi:hypothetical protein LCGC14_1101600 [marine sediment metagenome]|uniref:Uncharacterized protein n=1 Tax=marine sediment metagenome TaxID=412755 RepID=A0A0F9QFG5_9ZZZZ